MRLHPGGTGRAIGAAIAITALLLWAEVATADAGYEQRVSELRESGQLPEAAELACEWATAEPGSIPALRQCGELSAVVGHYSRAEESLRSLLFYTPSDPEVLVLLGEVLLDRGMYAQAREEFEAAIHAGGDPGPAYTGLARATLYDADSPGEVLSAAEVAVSVAPDYVPAQVALGAALCELGQLEDALDVLQRARELDPSYPRTTFELGRAWSAIGEETYARRAWERYVEMAPFAPDTWLLEHRLVLTDLEEITDRAFDAAYSPDGSRIAYRARGEGGWGIYTIPADGSVEDETKLWATEANVQSLAWSPDSSRIAVTVLEREEVNGKQQWTRKLFLVPAEGGEAEMLVEDRYMGEIGWNPATGRIGMRGYVRREGYRILEIDPETGESEEVPGLDPGTVYYGPTWSRDGSTLMAARRSDPLPDGSFVYDLLVGPADDFGKAEVIHSTMDLPRGATFTPDGATILYALPGAGGAESSIWGVPADGSRDPLLVDHMGGRLGAPSISPDGRFLLTTRETMLVRARLAGLGED